MKVIHNRCMIDTDLFINILRLEFVSDAEVCVHASKKAKKKMTKKKKWWNKTELFKINIDWTIFVCRCNDDDGHHTVVIRYFAKLFITCCPPNVVCTKMEPLTLLYHHLPYSLPSKQTSKRFHLIQDRKRTNTNNNNIANIHMKKKKQTHFTSMRETESEKWDRQRNKTKHKYINLFSLMHHTSLIVTHMKRVPVFTVCYLF